jgi:beta-glucosidase
MRKRNLFLTIALMCVTSVYAQWEPYQNPNLEPIERARDLVSRLTLEEKASLMQDVSPAIDRLGIPSFQWWNEALHGVGRNGYATVFPITTGMAASFDNNLLERVFTAVSDEARAKNAEARHNGKVVRYQGLSFWTPNINIFRDPRWGRGQETYGEDPYLTSMMGLAVVRGLQGPEDAQYKKLLACAKHFAVHSGPEWNRHSFNIENLPPRDLWETYLPAFKTLVQDGHVAEVMCAYQRIDGDPCCGNTRYLQQILRNDWGFTGLVTSDCGAVSDFWHSGAHEVSKNAAQASGKAVRSGTDLECGSNYKALPEAVKAGEVTEEQIDESLVRLLSARFSLGDFDSDENNPWAQIPMSVVCSKEHKALALQMARESIVLLQNRNGVLPLRRSAVSDIVVMGPNANDSTMMWGNYNGYPLSTTTILDGIRQKLGHVKYIQGCGITDSRVQESRYADISNGKQRGMKATYWNNTRMKGAPVATANISEAINLSNGGATVFAPGVHLDSISARYEGVYTAKATEEISFNLSFDDGARLIVNGDTIADVWKARNKIQFINKKMNVQAGKTYKIQIDYFQNNNLGKIAFDITHSTTPTSDQLLKEIGSAKTIVFVGGISPRLEGEEMKVDAPGFKGGDRTDIELPQSQRDIVAMLAKAGKHVIFVNCSGSAVGLEPETQNCDAIVQAWYGGQEGGKAVADVLFGDYNPSGKLPVTFYRHTSDLPDFENYEMKGRTYRYFTGDPLWAFGYGKSYTTFTVKPEEFVNGQLKVRIKNTGKLAGTETVQLYIRRTSDVNGPLKSLRGFQRFHLQPGEEQVVTMDVKIDKKALETWDEQTNTMRFVPGEYEIYVGTSSRDKDLRKYSMTIN